ncbi:MAG: long-chain-acyl-CoA synthetase [Deltaproteobacteria bacterium]|nr:long-chain-acyl-CoA synthetase [Deltaproteobacteria bacterium]
MTESINILKVVKFRQLIPGLLSLLLRLPTLLFVIKELNKVSEGKGVTIGLHLEENAVKFANNPAILYEDVRYTYKEFNQEINRYAHYFLSRGLKKGDTIVVFVENRPEYLIIVGAACKIGAITSLINTNQRSSALKHSINLAPGKMYLIGEELIDVFETIKPELEIQKEDTLCFLADKGQTGIPAGYIHLQEAVRDFSTDNPPTTSQITNNDPYTYIFTSGTTGLPKAAILPHMRWISSMLGFGKAVMNLKSSDILYCTMPLFHGTALGIAWPTVTAKGAALAIGRKFSARNFWKNAAGLNATAFVYIGELCRYLINQPPSPDDINNPIKKIIGNGLRPDIWLDFKKRFSIEKIYELYGGSEFPFIFVNSFDIDCTIGICSQPFAIVEYDMAQDKPVLDRNGFMQRVKTGETGLLLGEITPKTVFAGYTDREATKQKILHDVFQKGDVWLNSGDLLRNVGYNHAQFVDRLGDTYRWKGENVSSSEVEKVVNSLDQVSMSAAYGVVIPGFDGRAGMAAIIPMLDVAKFDLNNLAQTLKNELPHYAIPKFIRFMTEFETTATMKIKKTVLREQGFSPDSIEDFLFFLLPDNGQYVSLTRELHQEIIDGKYRF